ncbi:TetR/AcrR family transcriptional regulator [Mycolicibacterium komossense]|uniref:TetR/AcrR family transcriptional regulator n=1 Tax=Mycolicibacterium komossense TaxID=1779 RepID=A0ABT3CHB0_9MYCO|nr:TetR/AcrR family transcriptional regulator [Mycolicibacterium komossense]
MRTDAARNADRILRAAYEVYSELGPDAPLDAIARRAGVGERTLYRRFPSRAGLVRAVLDQRIAEGFAPAIAQSLSTSDPLQALSELIETATSFGVSEHNLLAAARRFDALADVSANLEAALAELTGRAQRAGLLRADLVADDLTRIVIMLNSVLWTMDPGSDGWRRYVALFLDAISTGERRPLPAAVPLRYAAASESWPL